MGGGRPYNGILLLRGIADNVGVPVSQLNFFVGCFVSLLLASFYREWLSVSTVSSTTRHIFNLLMGVLILGFVVGQDAGFLLLETVLAYTLMLILPAQYIHIGMFVFAFGFLSMCHIYLMLYPFITPTLDITYCQMVSTQKLTSLGFNLGDWHRYSKTPEKMTSEQKAYAVRKVPSFLEFSSYLLGFQSVVIGPFYFFNDYISFVDGSHYSQQLSAAGAGGNANYKLDSQRVPSPNKAVVMKVLQSLLWTAVHMLIAPLVPVERNTDPSFIQEHSLLYLIVYCVLSMFCSRAKYYFGWTIADAVNNAAGFGFSSFDENGEAKWDKLTNCRVKNIEFATSFKTYVDSWNLCSIRWLRYICYTRSPWNPTVATFFLSAVWHGFWPGYYIMFLSGALFTFTARKWRRVVRPHFQTSKTRCVAYDIFTWLATQITMGYITVPFVVLGAGPILTFYSHWYWAPHIIAVCILCTFPSGKSSTSSLAQQRDKSSTAVIDNAHNDVVKNHGKSKDL